MTSHNFSLVATFCKYWGFYKLPRLVTCAKLIQLASKAFVWTSYCSGLVQVEINVGRFKLFPSSLILIADDKIALTKLTVIL